MKLTLEVIEAIKVIQQYLEGERFYSLVVDQLGGVTAKSYLGSNYEYVCHELVNFQKSKLQADMKEVQDNETANL